MKKLIAAFLVTTFAVAALASPPGVTQKTFVLVHGAWLAPFAWQTVKQQLEANGNKVIVIELPGHGDDPTSPAACSIETYRDKVLAEMNDVKGKVILVGHSMAGMVVSAVAENAPERIEKLVYLAAYVPANGQSLMDLAAKDSESILGPSLIPSKDQLTLDVKQENIISIFCQDAPVSLQQLLVKQYRPEPAIPFTNKVALTENKFGSVDKYYIHTRLDHAIGMRLQDQMASAAHITKVYSLNAGHSPFLSQPAEVTRVLLKIAK